MKLIMPMAGEGSRFRDVGYDKVKILKNVFLLLEKNMI